MKKKVHNEFSILNVQRELQIKKLQYRKLSASQRNTPMGDRIRAEIFDLESELKNFDKQTKKHLVSKGI